MAFAAVARSLVYPGLSVAFMKRQTTMKRPRARLCSLSRRILQAARIQGGLAEPTKYGKTWTRVHDPLVWREAADSLLGEAGVRVIYHAVAIGVHLDGGEKLEGSMSGPSRDALRSGRALSLMRAAMRMSWLWRICLRSSETMVGCKIRR